VLLDLQGFLVPAPAAPAAPAAESIGEAAADDAAAAAADPAGGAAAAADDAEEPPPPRWASAVRMHLGRRAAMEGATEQREAQAVAVAEVVGYLPAGPNDPGPARLTDARTHARRRLSSAIAAVVAIARGGPGSRPGTSSSGRPAPALTSPARDRAPATPITPAPAPAPGPVVDWGDGAGRGGGVGRRGRGWQR
jgi:hypothetical protein